MDSHILTDMMLFVFSIVSVGCFTGIVTTWIKFRSGRQPKSSPELNGRLNEIASQLERLDTAIDAVALEVERISEGQRFTTRLLADRPGAPTSAESGKNGGSTTPHQSR